MATAVSDPGHWVAPPHLLLLSIIPTHEDQDSDEEGDTAKDYDNDAFIAMNE